jgi:hypothetical protein
VCQIFAVGREAENVLPDQADSGHPRFGARLANLLEFFASYVRPTGMLPRSNLQAIAMRICEEMHCLVSAGGRFC